MTRLRGAIAAASTPLADGGARLDDDAFGPYADFLVGAGLDGVLAFGTNGEAVLLTTDERRHGLERWLEAIAGRVLVAAHCGAQTTQDTVALAAHAAEAGADAVAVIGPPYFKLDTAAQRAHLLAAAAACAPLPFYVYEFAATAGYAFDPSMLARLREEADNVVGMKVSDAPWEAFERYLLDGFDIFVGPEALIHRGREAGAIGAVSALASAFPRRWRRSSAIRPRKGQRRWRRSARRWSRFRGTPRSSAWPPGRASRSAPTCERRSGISTGRRSRSSRHGSQPVRRSRRGRRRRLHRVPPRARRRGRGRARGHGCHRLGSDRQGARGRPAAVLVGAGGAPGPRERGVLPLARPGALRAGRISLPRDDRGRAGRARAEARGTGIARRPGRARRRRAGRGPHDGRRARRRVLRGGRDGRPGGHHARARAARLGARCRGARGDGRARARRRRPRARDGRGVRSARGEARSRAAGPAARPPARRDRGRRRPRPRSPADDRVGVRLPLPPPRRRARARDAGAHAALGRTRRRSTRRSWPIGSSGSRAGSRLRPARRSHGRGPGSTT